MTTRDELYQAFGPVLLEALMRVLLQQINVLRVQAGLNEVTLSQAIDAIKAELDGLALYDWLKAEE